MRVPLAAALLSASVIAISAAPPARVAEQQAPISDTVAARIARVEQGLLPGIVIAGRPLPTTTLADRMAALKTPGVSVAVINDGVIEWVKAYGVTEAGTSTAVTPRTLFQAASISKPVAALALSAKTGDGMQALIVLMKPGKTHAFVGSSGAGKSTLINSIAGMEIAATKEVREDDSRGRHATVTRQLYDLGEHGLLIDTPGMRELSLWGETPEFDLVSEYADRCRFKDCTHEHEPGCAVREAADKGEIPREIMESYLKLKKEAAYTASRADKNAALERKKKDKELGKVIKQFNDRRKSGRGGA